MSFSKTIFISPSLLYRDDLFSFETFLHDCEAGKRCEFQVTGRAGGKEISSEPCHSLQELLSAKDIPRHLDSLAFVVNEMGEDGKVIRNVKVNLDKRVSDIELNTEDKNNEWVKEISPKLKSFFKQRRPWYWFIGLSIPPIFNITMGLSLIMAAFIFVSKMMQALIFPSLSFLSGANFMVLGVNRVVFRHSRICLFHRDEDTRPNFELLLVVFHLTMLFFAIIGTIIMTVGKT